MHKIKNVTAKLYEWTGPTVPPLTIFCTNASDALPDFGSSSRDKMDSFRFHQWLVCEVETEDGLIGIGNAALCPPLIKKRLSAISHHRLLAMTLMITPIFGKRCTV